MQTPIGRDGHCQIVPLARDGEEITTRGDQRLSDEVETAFQVTVPLQIEQLVKKLTLDRFPQHAVCVEEHLKQHAIQNSFRFSSSNPRVDVMKSRTNLVASLALPQAA